MEADLVVGSWNAGVCTHTSMNEDHCQNTKKVLGKERICGTYGVGRGHFFRSPNFLTSPNLSNKSLHPDETPKNLTKKKTERTYNPTLTQTLAVDEGSCGEMGLVRVEGSGGGTSGTSWFLFFLSWRKGLEGGGGRKVGRKEGQMDRWNWIG